MRKFIPLYYAIFLFSACEPFFKGSLESRALQNLPNAEITDFVIRGYKEGILSWDIQAKRAEIFSEKKMTIFYQFVLYNYSKNGTVLSTASAQKGTYWENSEDVYMEGNVKVINEERTQLETHSLRYIKAEKKIKTRDRVKITRVGGDALKGKGLIADMGLKRVEILSQVSGGSY